MSYILEALKKAQAERQMGNAPTIHAPAVHAVPAARANRMPLVIGLAAGALVLAAAVYTMGPQPVPVPAPPQPAAIQVASAPAPAAAPVANSPSAPQVALLADPAPPEPPAAPSPASSARPAAPPAAPVPVPAQRVAEPVAARPSAPAPAPVASVIPAGAPEDTVAILNDLPEAVRREVPRVAFGGYIYSNNASDRLLLVDKMLRHEGEEVAPGLVLEKLLPKAAVMNYKGYRFRIPY